MRITIEHVQSAVAEMLGLPAIISENNVCFQTGFGGYNVEVYVSLYDKYPDLEDEEEQHLEVSFIPLDANHNDLVFKGRSYADILQFCNEVQRVVNWCSVLATRHADGSTIITLGRSINTSLLDLKRAAEGDVESEFGTAMAMVGEDFQNVVPVITNFAAGESSVEQAQKLLERPHTNLLM